MNCDANIILGYHWLRARDLNFLYDSDAVCLCAERDCTRLLTDAAELAVTVILELQWSSGAARRRWRVPSRRLRVAQTTQQERSCPPHLLELLAALAPASIRAVLPSDPVLGPQGSGGGGTGAGPPRCCLLPCGQSVGLCLRLPQRAALPPHPARRSLFACRQRARYAHRCCTSSTRRRSAGHFGRPLTPSDAPAPSGAGDAAVHLMGRVTTEVRALLQVAGAAGPAQGGARRLPAGSTVRGGGRGVARHGAHAPPVALAALPAVDGPLPGPRAHCARHVQARQTRDVARLPRVRRRAPAALPPTNRPPRWRLGCRPATTSGWP